MIIEKIYEHFLVHPRVETDSRKVKPGCLFFALKGENFNGNRFASDALEKGAAFVIIDEIAYQRSSKAILVDNVLKTLQDLSRFHRTSLGLPILAITGSNGKTTTKELIAAVLESNYNVSSTVGNLNNHIGVPLTLLKMDENTGMGVVEMGANHPGEIGELCAIADPDYGLITNIGHAHLEGFGSFEAIKKTKAELYDYLMKKGGTIFYNSDNPILTELVAKYPDKVNYGEKKAMLTGHPVVSPPFIHAKVNFPGEPLTIETGLTGRFNFENVMAAACVGLFFKVEPPAIVSAIKNYRPQNNRSQLIEKNGLRIVMDAYNANPTSMQASIESFVSEFHSPRYLILGDMLELGHYAVKEHAAIIRQIKKHPFEKVFLVGPVFKEVAENEPFITFLESAELFSYLNANPLKQGALLIKGSRKMELEKVLDVL